MKGEILDERERRWVGWTEKRRESRIRKGRPLAARRRGERSVGVRKKQRPRSREAERENSIRHQKKEREASPSHSKPKTQEGREVTGRLEESKAEGLGFVDGEKGEARREGGGGGGGQKAVIITGIAGGFRHHDSNKNRNRSTTESC